MVQSDAAAHASAELVARESYGRLIAYLARRWRDVAAAEDALSEAFATALDNWPKVGVPSKPEAWLLTVAQRKLTDAARGQAVRQREDLRLQLAESTNASAALEGGVTDDRLRLMLVCAHPSIDAAIRPALILQTVMGLEVRQMAGAFLLQPDTLNKRLVRAKAKIKATGMRFEQPAPEDIAPRLHALLEAIYAAYSIGWQGSLVDGDFNDQLGREAVYLAGVVASLLPDSAEALGFQALLLFCEARRPAQIDPSGEFVPLLEQDHQLWDGPLLRNAYELLGKASALLQNGPFQIEAAIQAAHCYRAHTGEVPWKDIAHLYQALVTEHPTMGARVGMAVAVAQAENSPARGLAILQAIPSELVQNFQPYWTAISYLFEKQGRTDEAIECVRRALGLTTQPRLHRYLQRRLRALTILPAE